MDKIRILYLEDNLLDFKALQRALEAKMTGFSLDHVQDEAQFKDRLKHESYDLIVADYFLPSYDGLKALHYTMEKHPLIPFILISGVAGEELAVDAIKNGASDYILKNNLPRIIPSIRQALVNAEEKKQKLRAEDLSTKYEFILNTSKSFMSLIDQNYTYEAINNAFAKAHNLIREDVIGKTLSEIWGEKSFRDIIKPNIDKSFANNEVHYQAWFEIPRLGNRFFEVTFYPFKNKAGEITHTVVDTSDITNRKEAEEALRESEEKYRTLVENARDAICIVQDEKIVYLNPAVYEQSGYTNKELIGKSFLTFVHPDERNKIKDTYVKRMAGEKVESRYDSTLLRKDGSSFVVEINAAAVRYSGKMADLVILRDISSRKQVEEKMKRQSTDLALLNDLNTAVNQGANLNKILDILWERIKLLFDTIGSGIYFVSENRKELILQRNVRANKSIRRIEKLIGRDLDFVKIPWSEESRYWNTFRTSEPLYIEQNETLVDLIREHSLSAMFSKFIPRAIKILGIHSMVNLPLLSEDGPVGILSIAKSDAFSDTDIARLQAFSSQITSILQRKFAEERIVQQADDQHLINELNTAVNNGKSLEQIMVILSESTRRMFSGYGATIYLISEDGKYLYPVRFPLPKKIRNSIEKLLDDDLTSLKVKLTEKSIFNADLKSGKPEMHSGKKEMDRLIGELATTKFQKGLPKPVADILNINHILNIPLIEQNESIGILNISRKTSFSQRDIERLQAIAGQVTTIIRRKRVELNLLESESKFKMLFDSANDAIFLLKDNNFIDCNNQTLDMFGCKREDILGKTPVVFSPDLQPGGKQSEELAEEKILAAQKGSTERFEWVHKRLDGSIFFAEVSLNQLVLKGEKYLQAIVRDISDRKETEEIILRNEEGLREAQRIASVGSWEWNMESDEVIWSHETYRILGLQPDTTRPSLKTFLKVVHKNDRENVQNIIRKTIDGKKSADFFHKIIRSDGEERDVHSRAEIITNRINQPVKFIGTIHDITELKKAQRDFWESEERFRAVFEKAHFAMVVTTPDGRLRKVNRAAENLFGYRSNELEGMHFKELTLKGDLAESLSCFRKLVKDEIPFYVLEKRYVRKNGEIIHCHTGVSSIKNEEGKVTNTVAMILDITEQKLAENEIIRRTEELTLINTLNSMANVGEDLDKIFQYFANDILKFFSCHITAIAMLTEDREKVVVDHISMTSNILNTLENLVDARVRKHVVKPRAKGMLIEFINSSEPQLLDSKEQIRQFILEFSTKEITRKLTPEIADLLNMKYVCNFPLRSGNESLGMIITVRKESYTERDINRMNDLFEQMVSIVVRKKVEEERYRLSTVVEQMAETVVITDTKGDIQYVNPAFERVTGYSRKEATGKNPRILQSGKHDPLFYRNLWETITNGSAWYGKLTNKRKNGSLFEERATISPLKDSLGEIVNYVAVKQDITREAQLEAQLIQSQKLETVGTLARGIAHDFNNILATILGYNDMALEEVSSGDIVYDYLTRIKKASNRAKNLVNQVLTFSKDVEPQTKSVKIQELIRDSIDLMRPTVKQNIKMRTSIDSTCPDLSVDPSQIQQVIINLLANANHSMRDTGGTLFISLDQIHADEEMIVAVPDLKPGNYIRLTISDTGTGMDAETMPRIFEPFFSTKPVDEGIGLGLSVVHGIIKNHKGSISVHSKPGGGTTFEVFLPL